MLPKRWAQSYLQAVHQLGAGEPDISWREKPSEEEGSPGSAAVSTIMSAADSKTYSSEVSGRALLGQPGWGCLSGRRQWGPR